MAAKQLHPGAKWLFRFKAFWTIIFLGVFFGFWIGAFMVGVLSALSVNIGAAIVSVILISILVGIVLIELYARLAYRFWSYEFTGDQLRIERGIIWKRYSNIPYQRIQNVDITRGIIARICGFSSVNIQTAGFSAPAGNQGGVWSEGYIPAVPMAEAEKIREFVVKKVGKKGHQGL